MTEAIDELRRSRSGHAIVELTGSPYYVQVLIENEVGSDRRRFLVEAVSNEFLADEYRITSAQELSLRRLGWSEPNIPCSSASRCSRDHPNWYRFAEVDDTTVVTTLLAGLGVYGASEGTRISVVRRCP